MHNYFKFLCNLKYISALFAGDVSLWNIWWNYEGISGKKIAMGGYRKFLRIFSHQRIAQRAVGTSLEKQLDPMGPIASRGVSILVFLRNL